MPRNISRRALNCGEFVTAAIYGVPPVADPLQGGRVVDHPGAHGGMSDGMRRMAPELDE